MLRFLLGRSDLVKWSSLLCNDQCMDRVSAAVAGAIAILVASSAAAMASSQAEKTIFYSGVGTAGANSGRAAGAYVMVNSKGANHLFDGAELWTGTKRCSSDRAVPRRTNRTFTRLVGYSLGRLGPAYYLQQLEQHKRVGTIRSIVLLDPGPAGEFECDNKSGAGYTYATWLRQNPANHLLIVTGAASAADGYKGIQDTYASKLTSATVGPDVSQRVLICDAPKVKHGDVDEKFRSLIGGKTQTSCPAGTSLNRYSPRTPSGGGGAGTPPPPPPPPSKSIQIGWSGAHQGWIWMTLNGFPTGQHQYTCAFGSGGDQTFTLTETASPETWDNGHTCYDTIHGDTVWVVVEGVASNTITVP
jgi:hypothetical protein